MSTPPSSAKDDADGGAQAAQKRSAASSAAVPKMDEDESSQSKRSRVEESPKDREATSEVDERLNKPVEELVKEDPMAAEKKAARERALVPLEERMAQFSQMLVENEVSSRCYLGIKYIGIYSNTHPYMLFIEKSVLFMGISRRLFQC